MRIVDLARVDARTAHLVGGKAAGLGELLSAGETVPAGFCLTTRAHREGAVPTGELLAAYRDLGGGPVAVRSSATTEDLPDASFAGQQDTFLDVTGPDALVDAVTACWASLHTPRAVAYRRANGIDEDSAAMAVIVQRMVDARTAGVLFTANPVTGCRTETVIDAAPGPGTTVVDGSADVDHHVLGPDPPRTAAGCLDTAQLARLHTTGRRVQQHFGAPQDIEWAFDHDGRLWLLQSRPITTLFPPPPPTDLPQPRVYLEFGHLEGMLRPFTPMGMSLFRAAAAAVADLGGIRTDPVDGPPQIVDTAGRPYLDLTDFVRHRTGRALLPETLRLYGPRAATALTRLMDDPRFAPQRGRPYRLGTLLRIALSFAPTLTVGAARALARPTQARRRALRLPEEARKHVIPPAALDSAAATQRLRFAQRLQSSFFHSRGLRRAVAPLATGMLASRIAALLLSGAADSGEVDAVLRGMPHNVTTEMDLRLWQLAAHAHEHRDLLLHTPPAQLAERHRNGTLPDIGLTAFLDAYGHRGAAEVDVGVPRWAEDPAPLFAALANYLRLTDPEQAPDRRFAEAARQAEAALTRLTRRARTTRPVRARLAHFLLRRARALAGLRELAKFSWLHPLAESRRQLLATGQELAARGLLDRADDIMFLHLREAYAAAAGEDLRDLVAQRRATHEREARRRRVPGLLLSDGTDLEALAPSGPAPDGALVGTAAAPGVASGPARVVLDPAGARIEPGEILVAPTTDPGWTPLFLTAAALVTETGSPIAHGPTVAREYGIPAVICVPDATRTVATGQRITVDGAAGTVRIDD